MTRWALLSEEAREQLRLEVTTRLRVGHEAVHALGELVGPEQVCPEMVTSVFATVFASYSEAERAIVETAKTVARLEPRPLEEILAEPPGAPPVGYLPGLSDDRPVTRRPVPRLDDVEPASAPPREAAKPTLVQHRPLTIEELRNVEAAPVDVCACCKPPVSLAEHTHAPIRDVEPTAEPGPLRPTTAVVPSEWAANRLVEYRPKQGEAREILLGPDLRVEVEVRGRTYAAADVLRKCGLDWNGETDKAKSVWFGRVPGDKLGILASLDDAGREFQIKIMEGIGMSEVPVLRARHPPVGVDFY